MQAIFPYYRRNGLPSSLAVPLILAVLAAMPALPTHAAAPTWKPADNVEIIAGSAPGGGIDFLARQMQKVLQDGRLVESPINVVNKPGAGGAIALGYLGQQSGNGHYIAIVSNTLLTSHITGISKHYFADFTPLAILLNDYVSFVTRTDSRLTSGKDLIARLKDDPASVTFGMASALGNINHIAIGSVARAVGVDPKKLKIVVFGSAGKGMTAGLGGHVDVVVSSPSIAAHHVEAAKMRALAVTSPRRLSGMLADTPTWKEQGIDAVLTNWRGVIGPPGMSEGQTAFWDQVFARLAQTEDWNDQLRKKMLESDHNDSKSTANYMKEQYDTMKRALTDLGFAK